MKPSASATGSFMKTTLGINGDTHGIDADPRTSRLDALRIHPGLAGSRDPEHPAAAGSVPGGAGGPGLALQARGIGALSICGSAAAILNAIHDATGVRAPDLPATPDKLIAGF